MLGGKLLASPRAACLDDPSLPPLCHLQFVSGAAAAVQRQLPRLASQGLANIAWGISQLPEAHPALPQLAQALFREAAPRLASFSQQELAMIAVACRHQPRCPQLLAALGQQLEERAGRLSDQDVATLLSGALGWRRQFG